MLRLSQKTLQFNELPLEVQFPAVRISNDQYVVVSQHKHSHEILNGFTELSFSGLGQERRRLVRRRCLGLVFICVIP